MTGKTLAAIGAALLAAAASGPSTTTSRTIAFPALGEDYCGTPDAPSLVASARSPRVAFLVQCGAAHGPVINTLVLAGADGSLRSFPIGRDLTAVMLGFDRDDRIYWASTWSQTAKAYTDTLKIWAFSEQDGAARVVGELKLPFTASVTNAGQGDDGWLLKTADTENGGRRIVYVAFRQGRLVRLADSPARRVLYWSYPRRAFIGATMDDDLRINGVYATGLDGNGGFRPVASDTLKGEALSTLYASAPTSPAALRVRKLGVHSMEADLLDQPGGSSPVWKLPDHVYTSAMADDGKHFGVAFDDRVEVYRTDGVGGVVGVMRSSDAHDAAIVFSAPANSLFVVEQTGVSQVRFGK